jgi:TonB family protein
MIRNAGWIAGVSIAGLIAGAQAVHAQGQPSPPEDVPGFGDHGLYVAELPEVIKKVPPVWPDEARRQGVTGTVMVQALVGKDGLVKDARVVKSIPLLDAAAVECVRQWVFTPAQNAGKPVAVWVAIPVKFGEGQGPGTPAPSPSPRRPPAAADRRATLVEEIAALQAKGPLAPSEDDFGLRRLIIHDALALDPKPRIPDEARAHFGRGVRARGHAGSRDSTLRAVNEFAAALFEAPWWAPAYLEISRALQRLDRRSEAATSLELYLLAEPQAPHRERIEKELVKLRKDSGAAK